MKKVPLILIVLLIVLLQCCTEEHGVPLENEKIQFSFSTPSKDASSGRTASLDLPEGTMLRISVTTNTGVAILEEESITVLQFNDDYITEPIELQPGQYKVTEFMLVHEGQVLYAVPKAGSALASLVSNTLPHEFIVSKNVVTNVPMEVVDISSHTPEELGYVSFNIDAVRALPISLFALIDGKMAITSGLVSIFKDSSRGESISLLNAKENLIAFKGHPDSTYTLTIWKEGSVDYTYYTRQFSYNALMEELNGKALQVVLEPIGSNFRFLPGEVTTLGFNSPGSITIHWGDGNVESKTFHPQNSETTYIELKHNYDHYFYGYGYITGDVDKIISVSQGESGGLGDLAYLPNLKVFHQDLATFDDLDLSKNYLLEELHLQNVHVWEEFSLPVHHNIKNVALTYIVSNIIEITINNVYSNTVAKDIRGGTFIIANAYETIPEELMVKLYNLRDHYNWNVEVSIIE